MCIRTQSVASNEEVNDLSMEIKKREERENGVRYLQMVFFLLATPTSPAQVDKGKKKFGLL